MLAESRGGIQRFNELLCRAIDELAPDLRIEGTVFTLENRDRVPAERLPRWSHLRYEPSNGKARLLARLLSACAVDRPEGLLIGHIGMSPLGLLASPFLRNGYAVTAHGIEAWDIPRVTRRFAVRRACWVFAVSSYTAQLLGRASGLDPSRIRLLPNTLGDEASAAPDENETDGRDALEILSVCRLEQGEGYKGIDHALRAFARLVPRHPALRYRIVGKGSDKPRHVELARTLGLGDHVVFEEDLDDSALENRYRRCAVFLLPSGKEGFGIVFLEAMRHGKPCIAGMEGGSPEVVEDGSTGLLVRHGDVDALTRALETMVGDPELRRAMGEAGRRRVREQFSFESFRGRVDAYLRAWLGAP